jgi:sortase A
MNYKKCFAAIAIVAIAACAVLGIVFIERFNLEEGFKLTSKSNSSVEATQYIAKSQEDNQVSEIGISEESEKEYEPITTETPIDMQIVTSSNKVTKSEVFAKITIKTCEKTGTYTVMSDVNERTLKNNIGWLPSSSLPGEDGLCVLMGHRDTDFKILQDKKIGDEIIIEYGELGFVYTVTKVEVVDKDNELRFSVMPGANLVLVTCYPFHYVGHAPRKLVVFAKKCQLSN